MVKHLKIDYTNVNKFRDDEIWSYLSQFRCDYNNANDDFHNACRGLVSDIELKDFIKNKPDPLRKIGDIVWYPVGEMQSAKTKISEVLNSTENEIRFYLGYSKAYGKTYLRDCCYRYKFVDKKYAEINGKWI